MTKPTIHRLKGDWFDESGYLSDISPRYLDVIVEGGKVYDEFHGRPFMRLALSADAGTVTGWAAGYFMPDDIDAAARIWAPQE